MCGFPAEFRFPKIKKNATASLCPNSIRAKSYLYSKGFLTLGKHKNTQLMGENYV